MNTINKLAFLIVVLNIYQLTTAEELLSEIIGNVRSLSPLGRLVRNSAGHQGMGFKEATEALKLYYDQFPEAVTKKIYFTPKLGRSFDKSEDKKQFDNVNFTPRLGRKLSDDFSVTPSDFEIYRPELDQIDKLFPSRRIGFSPRLGRSVNFSPRLGREMAYEMYPENVRVERSLKKTKNDASANSV